MTQPNIVEDLRLKEYYKDRTKNWLKWGPYLSERQWGTVREDYSGDGNGWEYLTHEQARSRAYRWGEDGIGGISNDHQELCFAMAFWNGKDPILKERLFGLNNLEGNHGEDVKELYYYLDNTPSHSYMKMLYKYPQNAFPYDDLLKTNASRSKSVGEYELLDTGIFNENRYFDIFIEYSKVTDEDIFIKITAFNRGPEKAQLYMLPTLWFRNRWDFGLVDEKPFIKTGTSDNSVHAYHSRLGNYYLYFPTADKTLFTENETNTEKLFNSPNKSPLVKDSFHDAVIKNNYSVIEGISIGTKCSPVYNRFIESGGSFSIVLRFSQQELADPFSKANECFSERIKESDAFYQSIHGRNTDADLCSIQRQALAGMLWSKQYYNLDIPKWLNGDKGQLLPPESRKQGRNSNWIHLNNADIISMPDKWEYPWYAAWDLAFHCVSLALVDVNFAKQQLLLILKEWYMHPNGQIPAYEWGFGDVNPPVHARAALKVYYMEKKKTGNGDLDFLKRVFHKLLVNFTWWIDRKDESGKNIFEGGFLGLDNIGIFDRSHGVPGNGKMAQADGTCWMAMYSLDMLDMAVELAIVDRAYEDMCTKFFDHYIYISEALNNSGIKKNGLWDEKDGLFYDHLELPNGEQLEIKVKSLVGLVSVFAMLFLEKEELDQLPNLKKGIKWFLNYREENGMYNVLKNIDSDQDLLLSVVEKDKLVRMLELMLDENEFLSPFGIRSVSRYHLSNHYKLNIDGNEYGMVYDPGESSTGLFGGNSNWRGPVWIPMNYLLLDSLEKYYQHYGESLKIEYPTKSGKLCSFKEIYNMLANRIIDIFTKDNDGKRTVHGEEMRYASDPHFKDLVLFYEYYHGETGKGLGASHQTGWSGLTAVLIDTIYNNVTTDQKEGMGTLK